jgi:tetratricopeptide (TPR) repeat protein
VNRDISLIPKTAELNNRGIYFERAREVELAISCYEENVKLRQPATHAYERLMVLYKRSKKFEDEIRIIRIAIDIFDNDKYRKRLEKAIKKFQPNGQNRIN